MPCPQSTQLVINEEKSNRKNLFLCFVSKFVVFFSPTKRQAKGLYHFFNFIANACVKKCFIFTTPTQKFNPLFFSSNVLNDACLFNSLHLLKWTSAVTGNYNCSEGTLSTLQNSRNFQYVAGVNKRKKRGRMKRSKTISFPFACPKYILLVLNYFLLEKVKTREVFFSLVKTKIELQFDCVVKRSKMIFFPCACLKYILFVLNYFLLEKVKTFSF